MENGKREDLIDILTKIISERSKTNHEETDRIISVLAAGIGGISSSSVYSPKNSLQLVQLGEMAKAQQE